MNIILRLKCSGTSYPAGSMGCVVFWNFKKEEEEALVPDLEPFSIVGVDLYRRVIEY